MNTPFFFLYVAVILTLGIVSGYFVPLPNYAWYWKLGGTLIVAGGLWHLGIFIIDNRVTGLAGLFWWMVLFVTVVPLGLGWLIGRFMR